MPFPDLAQFCAKPDLDACFKPPGLQIRMPGGGVITVPSAGVVSPGDQASRLLGAFNSALMPLMPLFDIIDALLTIKKVFDAVKSLDPIAIGNAVGGLIPKIAKLAMLIPPLSVPAMLKDILKVVICLLQAIEDELRGIAALIAKANLALSRGNTLGLPDLVKSAECQLEVLNFQFEALSSGTEPLNRLFVIINTVAELAGQGPLPPIEAGQDVDAAVTSVEKARTALEVIYAAIPG